MKKLTFNTNVPTKFLICLSACVAACFTSSKGMAETTLYPSGYSFGGGFGLHHSGPALMLEIKSPVLMTVQQNQYFKGRYSVYADGSMLQFSNFPVEGESRLKHLNSNKLGFGLNIQQVASSNALAVYSKLGIQAISPSKELSSEKQLYGGKLAFGIEFPYDYRTMDMAKNGIDNAFFAELGLDVGFKLADKQPGKPDLFNGVSMLLGSRSYY